MSAGLLARFGAGRRTRAALRGGLIVAAVILILLSLRRTGERTGRLPEHLDAMEPRLVALAASTVVGSAGSRQKLPG